LNPFSSRIHLFSAIICFVSLLLINRPKRQISFRAGSSPSSVHTDAISGLSRVARFSWYNIPKRPQDIQIGSKIYQMAVK
jgi:hypothetical protein